MRGGICTQDVMAADMEELENLDASETHARRVNAKKVLMPKMVKLSSSLSQMEQSSCLEEIRFSEDPAQFGTILHETKHKDDLQGESVRSQPLHTLTDDNEARKRFVVDRRALHVSSSR